MRKRVVIGVLAIIGIGVLVFVLSQPKPGTVEYHKREYRAAREEMFGRKWYSSIARVVRKVISIPQRQRSLSLSEAQALQQRQTAARDALIKLGYLVERRFTLSNQPAQSIIGPVLVSARDVIPQETRYYTCVLLAESNLIVLAAAPADVPKWEELIRKADGPEAGK